MSVEKQIQNELMAEMSPIELIFTMALCSIAVHQRMLSLAETFEEIDRTWHRHEHEAKRLIRELEERGVFFGITPQKLAEIEIGKEMIAGILEHEKAKEAKSD